MGEKADQTFCSAFEQLLAILKRPEVATNRPNRGVIHFGAQNFFIIHYDQGKDRPASLRLRQPGAKQTFSISCWMYLSITPAIITMAIKLTNEM
jgi:hypothetical protein